jgi:hypothetical protein
MPLILSTKRRPKTSEQTEKASGGMQERRWEVGQCEGRVMIEFYGDKS